MKNSKWLLVMIFSVCSLMSAYVENNDHGISGMQAGVSKKTISSQLQLFSYADCRFCTRVIDFLKLYNLEGQVTLIDADVAANKELLLSLSGKTQAPYLVDVDANIKMPESLDIIAYLTEKFNIVPAKAAATFVQPVDVRKLRTYDSSTFLSYIQNCAKPVIILVSTTWCPPCQVFKPIFQEVAEQMSDSCEFILLDGDFDEDIVTLLKVRSYPTVICYNHGQKINPINYRTKTGLLNLIAQLLQD